MSDFTSSVRRARKPHPCENCYGSRHWDIQPGDLYRRHVAFPGGEMGYESIWAINECWRCAAERRVPLIGPKPDWWVS